MKENYNITARAKGQLTIQLINDKTGKVVKESTSRNLIVRSGTELLASLLAGRINSGLNTMYMQFRNVEEYSPPAPNSSDTISYFTSDLQSLGHDYIRSSILGSPVLLSSESGYTNNRVVFTSHSGTPATGQLGVDFIPGTSIVYGGGLVFANSPATAADDILFARAIVENEIPFITGHQVAMRWIITFS